MKKFKLLLVKLGVKMGCFNSIGQELPDIIIIYADDLRYGEVKWHFTRINFSCRD
jgi:hypothetical protein